MSEDVKRGKFIVIDGMDGSGKGTQLKLLQEALKGLPVHYTREPGGTGSDTAEFLRKVILEADSDELRAYNINSVPLCDFFLFWASRAQHVEEVVEPKRKQGIHVISDRYDSSTLAFQIYGEQKDFRHLFQDVRRQVPPYFWPEAYIILDLPAEVAYERRRKDDEQKKTRFDLKPLEYHQEVRRGFGALQRVIGGSYSKGYLVDANRPVPDVFANVINLVRHTLEK